MFDLIDDTIVAAASPSGYAARGIVRCSGSEAFAVAARIFASESIDDVNALPGWRRHDNRTAGFRIVGRGDSLRIECRIPGADCNPYLAFAAALASGLEGVAHRIEPPPHYEGDVYAAEGLASVPMSLREATDLFEQSEFTRRVFGEATVAHYTHFFREEQRAYDSAVTDWERRRYFERI